MRSVTLKSAITPSFMGLMATMLPGVRPSISLASLPTASTSPVDLLIATMDGSLTTMPLPWAETRVFAVPKSMARSEENKLKRERRFIDQGNSRQARTAADAGAKSLRMITRLDNAGVLFSARVSRQNDNVLFGQSRNVLLTGSSLEGGQRTATDDPGRARPAGGPEEGQQETDHAEAGSRGDRRHGAAGAETPAQVAANRGPRGNP